MKIASLVSLVVIGIAAMSIETVAQSSSQAAKAAIRTAAGEFAKAFDRGDAVALADHFTLDGIYIDEHGDRFQGRDVIRKEYEQLFADQPNLRLKTEIDSIQIVNDETVIEEGRSAILPQSPGGQRVMSQYTAIHTLKDGKWLMAHVRDTQVVLPPESGDLADLEWLVGSWVSEAGTVEVKVTSRWIEDRRFLARSHTVTQSGKPTFSGLQIVGRNPSTGQINSWSFNNDGGHAVGIWAPHSDGWVVESNGVMTDGTPTSAVNILSRKDDDTLLWKSGERFAGDVALPDVKEVTLQRVK